MNAALLSLACLLAAGGPGSLKDRERHPLAPSLPLLTREESKKIDHIIAQFIEYDIGKLKGTAGKKALDDFNRLGPESIFNLIDGLNQAANMQDSCPAVILAKRVGSILRTTEDLELLAYAKATIGSDVTGKRHLGVLKDLQATILFRKADLQRRGIKIAPAKGTTGPDLQQALASASGPQLQSLVQRQTGDVVKSLLKHDRKDVRIAAAQAIGARKLRYGTELIGLLQDANDDVRQAARQALVQISGGLDHGPMRDASFLDREEAIARWQAWWSKQK